MTKREGTRGRDGAMEGKEAERQGRGKNPNNEAKNALVLHMAKSERALCACEQVCLYAEVTLPPGRATGVWCVF